METSLLSAEIGRREALRRICVLLGAAVSAPTLVGVLNDAHLWAATPDAAWKPRTLNSAQNELVAAIAEHIIPTTDTPGARRAGVHRFIDVMLTDYYPHAERQRFLTGLQTVDARAESRCDKPFMACSVREQTAILTDIDSESYPPRGQVTRTGALYAYLVYAARTSGNPTWWWRRMKELTMTGYYTSQLGATRELGLNPQGPWCLDPPYLTQPACIDKKGGPPGDARSA